MSATFASAEERAAWDAVVAATIGLFDISRPEMAAALASKLADVALEERRKRFAAGVQGPR